MLPILFKTVKMTDFEIPYIDSLLRNIQHRSNSEDREISSL